MFTQIDSRPNWYDIDILYKQTKIWTGIGIALDGGRAFTNVPETEYLACGKQGIIYKYYVENTLPYQIHKFFLMSLAMRLDGQMKIYGMYISIQKFNRKRIV